MRRRVLLVKMFASDSVRIAVQRKRAITQMRQDDVSDFGVIRDDLPFGESVRRKEYLLCVRDRQLSTIDLDFLFARHRWLDRGGNHFNLPEVNNPLTLVAIVTSRKKWECLLRTMQSSTEGTWERM